MMVWVYAMLKYIYMLAWECVFLCFVCILVTLSNTFFENSSHVGMDSTSNVPDAHSRWSGHLLFLPSPLPRSLPWEGADVGVGFGPGDEGRSKQRSFKLVKAG